LRCNFVVAARPQGRFMNRPYSLIFMRALHLELFTKPSFGLLFGETVKE